MRRRRAIRLALTVVSLTAVALAQAQEMKIRQLRMLPDGQMIWSAGSTISKAGVTIAFEPHLIETKFAGYKLESAATEALKQGDVVLLYFPGLKVIGDPPKSRRDVSGAKVFGDSHGAWRAVTIEAVARAGARVTVTFNDELTLNNQQKIRRLELAVVDGFLLPEMAVAAAATPTTRPATNKP